MKTRNTFTMLGLTLGAVLALAKFASRWERPKFRPNLSRRSRARLSARPRILRRRRGHPRLTGAGAGSLRRGL
jgi:hypothetical protein